MKTLNELNKLVEKERELNFRKGQFGIEECKESIKFKMECGKTLQQVYQDLIIRGLTEQGFNISMIVACEEMMNKVSE